MCVRERERERETEREVSYGVLTSAERLMLRASVVTETHDQ